MHAPALMAKKWTFEMNAQRPRLRLIFAFSIEFCGQFDRIGESLQRSASLVERRGNGRREIARDSMRNQKLIETGKFVKRCPHDVEPRPSVHVYIDESGRQNGIGIVSGKVDYRRIVRNLARGSRRHFREAAVFDEDQRVQYLLEGRK